MGPTTYTVHWGQMIEVRGILNYWRSLAAEAQRLELVAAAAGDEDYENYHHDRWVKCSGKVAAIEHVLEVLGLLNAVNGGG